MFSSLVRLAGDGLIDLSSDCSFILIRDFTSQKEINGDLLLHHFISASNLQGKICFCCSWRQGRGHFLGLQRRLSNFQPEKFIFQEGFSGPFDFASFFNTLDGLPAKSVLVLDRFYLLEVLESKDRAFISELLSRVLVACSQKLISLVLYHSFEPANSTCSWFDRLVEEVFHSRENALVIAVKELESGVSALHADGSLILERNGVPVTGELLFRLGTPVEFFPK